MSNDFSTKQIIKFAIYINLAALAGFGGLFYRDVFIGERRGGLETMGRCTPEIVSPIVSGSVTWSVSGDCDTHLVLSGSATDRRSGIEVKGVYDNSEGVYTADLSRVEGIEAGQEYFMYLDVDGVLYGDINLSPIKVEL